MWPFHSTGSHSLSSSKARIEELSREAIIIHEALADASRRKMLITELSKQNEDEANLIRLFQYCREYRAIGKTTSTSLSLTQIQQERTALGRKIISMFIQPGSLYEVKGLDANAKKRLLDVSQFKEQTFDEAHSLIGSILEHSDRIVRTAQKIGVIHSTVMEAIKIMTTVEDDKRRRMLINELVEENLEEAHDLRFFQACKEYKTQKDSKKMAALGRKIITMFIEAGSLHELTNLDSAIKKKLLSTNRFTSTTFDEAAESVLNSLENSSTMVANKIGVVESSILSSGKSGRLGAPINGIDQDVFERMMNNPLLASEFETFVRDEYIDELWKFRTDVSQMKFQWNDLTPDERKGKAAEIFESSVKVGSPYEINIAGTMRSAIEEKLNNAITMNTEVPADLFDAALKEVSTVLLQNINYRVMNAVKLTMGSGSISSTSSDDINKSKSSSRRSGDESLQ